MWDQHIMFHLFMFVFEASSTPMTATKRGGGCHELPRKILKLEEMKQRERTARSGEREKGVKGDMN